LADLNATAAARAIDDLIEKRSREMEALAAAEREDKERARSYLRRRKRDHRDEWIDFYQTLLRAAESMRARALRRLGELIDEGTR
jgi:hypothetical protein